MLPARDLPCKGSYSTSAVEVVLEERYSRVSRRETRANLTTIGLTTYHMKSITLHTTINSVTLFTSVSAKLIFQWTKKHSATIRVCLYHQILRIFPDQNVIERSCALSLAPVTSATRTLIFDQKLVVLRQFRHFPQNGTIINTTKSRIDSARSSPLLHWEPWWDYILVTCETKSTWI